MTEETPLTLEDLLAGARLLLAAMEHVAVVNWCLHGELVRECPICTPPRQETDLEDINGC